MVDVKENMNDSQDLILEPNIQDKESSPSTHSSSSDYTTGETDDNTGGKSAIPASLKSMEHLLMLSKGCTSSDLEEMIAKCKSMVLESSECSEERRWLVRRLIELRLRLQELKEIPDESLLETQVIFGHHLIPQRYMIPPTGPVYCDHCSGAIWTVVQSWYMCSDCKFCCHWKCLSSICRMCVHVIASEANGYTYTKDICPEKGLSGQGYRCAECRRRITFKSTWTEPRICDYSGLYFCHKCHWNTMCIIPARVIRNWDMEPRRVSRAAAQLLALLENRPVLSLETLNPMLFTLVPDLSFVKRMREELQLMKQYLVLCPEATSNGLPWKTNLRSHMIENSGNYSIKDLVDLQSGKLLEEIRTVHEAMHCHITEKCELCRGRGHLCELCGNDEVIFPWDGCAITCTKCLAIHHRACWSKKNQNCLRCLRLEERRARRNLIAEGEDALILELGEG
ncbi:differentially expressed in FDCP 8 homolog isoform X2 [Prorops nasuta]|uniref:differentially expressed in FDCP 8 homolog isoform X2 n=1 Tax=Prorops nasuta TaxID=863751 RepID=UPI0034CE0498